MWRRCRTFAFLFLTVFDSERQYYGRAGPVYGALAAVCFCGITSTTRMMEIMLRRLLGSIVLHQIRSSKKNLKVSLLLIDSARITFHKVAS